MHLTKSEIFQKSWLWSIICGIAVASLFWFITSLGNWFHLVFGGVVSFFDTLIALSIAGCYFGAGYVGNRIAHKYYHDKEKRFSKRYTQYSILSFVLLVAIVYSPLSFLGLLWSLIPPYCVLKALDHIKKPQTSRKKQ